MRQILTIFAIAIVAMGNYVCEAQNSMPVPTNKFGFYDVLDCPTSLSFIKATAEQANDDTYNVNIYRGRNLAQTINCGEVTSGDLHFLDINFDGNIDIMVGPAASRNSSTILLWDDAKGEFVNIVGNEIYINGNILVNPSKKYFVTQGSGSYCSMLYTKYGWKGNQLVPLESIIEITDPTAYKDYGVTTQYTFLKGNDYYSNESIGKVKVRTNKIKKLPKEWQNIIKSYFNP